MKIVWIFLIIILVNYGQAYVCTSQGDQSMMMKLSKKNSSKTHDFSKTFFWNKIAGNFEDAQFDENINPPAEIKCLQISKCPMALKLLETKRNNPETKTFLKSTFCGFEGNTPKVWCSLIDVCQTPDDTKGICTEVKHCKSVLELADKLNKNDVKIRRYLDEFRCGNIYDPSIKVCCPYGREKYRNIPREKDNEFSTENIDISNVDDRYSSPKPSDELCGLQSTSNKIYGGVEADIDEFPWMTLLKYTSAKKPGKFIYGCGGTLISSNVVLTAAHCLDPSVLMSRNLKKLYKVILGEYDVRNETDCIYHKYGMYCADPATEHDVDSVVIHPEYVYGSTDHDIGLVRLQESVRITDFVRPICLPDINLTLSKSDIYMIAGWGKTAIEPASAVKRKASIELMPKERCEEYSSKNLDDSRICGGSKNGAGSCFGDSGGPLMLGKNFNNQYRNFIVGVISHGWKGRCGAKPIVYTYVPYYIDWIQSYL